MPNIISRKAWWTGTILKSFIVLFLGFDAVIHILNIPVSADALTSLGYQSYIGPIIGIIGAICLILYIIPKTSVLGAILWTGYLGGAVASNLRVEYSLFGNVLFPVYIGIIVWLSLFFLEPRLRALIPYKRFEAQL